MNLKLLKNRTFILFVFGTIITVTGDTFLNISLALYVLHITGSAVKYSFIISIAAIPTIILGPISGSLVDKFDKKKILIFSDLFRGALLIGLIILTYGRDISLIEVYAITFIFGICSGLYSPCISTVIPSIVEGKELAKANSIYMTLTQIGLIVAPMLGVLIYNAKGISTIILIDAITFFIMSLIAVFYKLKKTSNNNINILENIKDGFKLYKDKEILSLSINGVFSYIFVIPLFAVGLPFIITNLFNGTSENYATIQTVISVSSIGVIATVPIISRKLKEIKALNLTMYGMVFAISIMLLLVNNSFFNYIKADNFRMVIFLSLVCSIFYLSFSNYGVFFQTINQRKVDKKFLGRYYSVLMMLFGIANILGSSLFGFLCDTKVILYPVMVAVIGMVGKILLNRMITPIEEPENIASKEEGVNNSEVISEV